MCQIDAKTATDFLLPRHYSGRRPQISIAFGLYIDNKLNAVCTFGKPASPVLWKTFALNSLVNVVLLFSNIVGTPPQTKLYVLPQGGNKKRRMKKNDSRRV